LIANLAVVNIATRYGTHARVQKSKFRVFSADERA
jgi:hypothetical protein